MNFREAVNMAIEGLDEGYRVIAYQLNGILSTRFPTIDGNASKLRIKADDKKETDCIYSACDKLTYGWHFMGNKVPPLDRPPPWIIGLISFGKPYFVPVSNPGGYEYVLPNLERQTAWTREDWEQIVVLPVAKYQEQNRMFLCELVPGVSLRDGATFFNEDTDDNVNGETVDRWSRSGKITATKLRKDPRDKRAWLYDMHELARDLLFLEKKDPSEKQRLLQYFERITSES